MPPEVTHLGRAKSRSFADPLFAASSKFLQSVSDVPGVPSMYITNGVRGFKLPHYAGLPRRNSGVVRLVSVAPPIDTRGRDDQIGGGACLLPR